MIKIYTTPSSASSRKMISWFKKWGQPYQEIRLGLFNEKEGKVKGRLWLKEELKEILQKSENGFEDIISTRCKNYYRYEKLIPEMDMEQLMNSIIEYPNLLRYPIIVSDFEIQTGYNHEDIQVYLKPEIRQVIIDYYLKSIRIPKKYQELVKDYD